MAQGCLRRERQSVRGIMGNKNGEREEEEKGEEKEEEEEVSPGAAVGSAA